MWGALVPMLVLMLVLSGPARAQTQKAPTPGGDAALRRADAAFKAGYAAMQAGKLEEAREDFAEAVKAAPRVPEARMALGVILVQLGRPEEAVPEFEEALKLKPVDEATQGNLALAHESWGKKLLLSGAGDAALSKAIEQLRTAVAVEPVGATPGRAVLQYELGSVLAQRKEWTQAEAAFREALRLNSDQAATAMMHMRLGVVLLEEKQFPQGLTELETATKAAPANAMIQFELGRGLGLAGRDEEAIPHLQEALRLSPAGEYALELGMAEQRLGQQQESIPYFQKAVEQEPRNAVALTNLGLALTQTGKASEAMPYFQRALAITPKEAVLLEDIGVAELQQSHFDEAIGRFEAALQVDKDNPQLHYDLGLAYKLKDRMDDAVRELKEAARLDGTLPDPPYTLGILYMQMGKLDDAVTQLRAALAVRPENGDGWAILGSTLKQAGKPAEAEEALRKAIELLPNQPGPHITLAGVFAEQGKRDEATAERKIAAGLSRTAVSRQKAMFSTNAGNQLLLRGDVEGAVGRYLEAIAADPEFGEAHAQLAVAYERQGRAEDAKAEREKAEGTK